MIDPTNLTKVRMIADMISPAIKYSLEILNSHHYFNKEQSQLTINLANQLAATAHTVGQLLGSNQDEHRAKIAAADPSEDYP